MEYQNRPRAITRPNPWRRSADTPETVRYCVRTEAGCWYEAENETLDPDEATKMVTVDKAYLDAHLPIVTRCLAQAGVRLGHLLNQALGGG